MARDDAPPFARGDTYYNGGTIDTTNLGGVNYEGKEYVFEPVVPNATTTPDTSGRKVRVKVVRNVSGAVIKPARLCHYKPLAGLEETQVDGYCFALGDVPAGMADEFLPAAGVPNNDLFYLVVEGPTKATQTHSSNSSLVVGTRLVPTAGGASTLTDDLGGRVLAQDLTGATATLGNNIQNCIGFSDAVNNTIDAQVKVVMHLASGR